ncbi:sulfurtransferase FdhD [Sphaerotilus microaerophilus]|uniref:Sulfur carrier protein FdhD n=2 Tax=Sphaerotilus microaerophilus TaxID=2914710 RepID=A0ABM7YQI3_9BURK|nr:sulfurtransferase FdhD [Sphaerotilus sp. FB-5]
MPPIEGTRRATAWRLEGERRLPGEERLAEERPVALVYNGISHAVMLASPLDLEDFALGFSLSEGIINSADDLLDFEEQGEEQVEDGVAPVGITLQLRVTLRCFMRLKERRRTLAGRTGCGLCGTESLAEAVRPVRRAVPAVRVEATALQRAMDALDAAQRLQRATGATHAAGWFDLDGRLCLAREDVGRHNALDKVIGAAVRAGRDPAQAFVAVTSRASYEMVYKTAQAGVGLLAAISAPTALAVQTAEAAGLVLAGFVRQGRVTVYAGAERVSSAG